MATLGCLEKAQCMKFRYCELKQFVKHVITESFLTPRAAIRQFAKMYGLEAGVEVVDGDRFFCAIKPGADVTFDGWIVAEDEDGEHVLFKREADDVDEDRLTPEQLLQLPSDQVKRVIDSWSP